MVIVPEIHVQIKNLAQIKDAFARSPAVMARELNIAIQKAVLLIGRQSRINTPVDTGRLRASTYERFSNLKGEVGTNTNYDLFVHEGTRFMRPRPYLRSAVETNDTGIQVFFREAVQHTLDKIAKDT